MSVDIIEFEEGYCETPYYDTLDYPTVGIGKRLGPKDTDLDLYQITVPESVAKAWLEADTEDLELEISCSPKTFQAWENCNQARKDILLSMAYQLGFDGLCEFEGMLSAIGRKDFDSAATEALDSLWYKQTPGRAIRHSDVLRSGTYSAYDDLIVMG